MKSYKYMIVGGGMTAAAAVNGIRETDPDGKIGLFSLESDPPYDRPPLTKGLWKGKPIDKIWRETADEGLDLYLEHRIQSLDPQNKQIADARGNVFQFEKLLLATGGKPNRLPFGGDQIIYLRTLADYRRLRSLTQTGKRFGVIGGGFIGSEIAAALAANDAEVTMAFPEDGIGARNFPRDLSVFLNDYYRQKGVKSAGRGNHRWSERGPKPAGLIHSGSGGHRGGWRRCRNWHPTQYRTGQRSGDQGEPRHCGGRPPAHQPAGYLFGG